MSLNLDPETHVIREFSAEERIRRLRRRGIHQNAASDSDSDRGEGYDDITDDIPVFDYRPPVQSDLSFISSHFADEQPPLSSPPPTQPPRSTSSVPPSLSPSPPSSPSPPPSFASSPAPTLPPRGASLVPPPLPPRSRSPSRIRSRHSSSSTMSLPSLDYVPINRSATKSPSPPRAPREVPGSAKRMKPSEMAKGRILSSTEEESSFEPVRSSTRIR